MSKLIIALTLALALSGCVSTDYHFGDLSKTYCSATDPAVRAALRAKLIALGVLVPVNYCAAVGIVDALIVTDHEAAS
mgnify:CR=1 FL=1